MFWLWVYMDTTKACYYTPNTLLDRYGGWLEPGTEPDSIGFGAISVTYDLETGDNAQFADSLNLVAGDGYYTHDQYGYWKYEDIIAPLAGYINQWRIYNIAVPVCGKITINITARDDLREITIIKYRFGAIK